MRTHLAILGKRPSLAGEFLGILSVPKAKYQNTAQTHCQTYTAAKEWQHTEICFCSAMFKMTHFSVYPPPPIKMNYAVQHTVPSQHEKTHNDER